MSGARPAFGVRSWVTLVVIVAVTVAVAVQTVAHREDTGGSVDPGVALADLARIPVSPSRLSAPSYERSAFGPAWTDATDAGLGGNGCDTRNDILARDLRQIAVTPVESCPNAVAEGELVSPYTGDRIDFRRGRDTGSAVQIDHIVPLSYAWDMGAARWPAAVRVRFANDPANLVAVDGPSNQDKSDSPPAQWMPPSSAFACAYAVQFVVVAATYGLTVDRASWEVLRGALGRCR